MNFTAALLFRTDRAVRFLPPVVLSVLILLTNSLSVKAQGCVPLPPYASDADRIGVNVITDYGKTFTDYDSASLKAGWFIDYWPSPKRGTNIQPSADNGTSIWDGPVDDVSGARAVELSAMAYAPVIRVADLNGTWRLAIRTLVRKSPGMLWIIGNEPDRHLQDATTPQEYAVLYHDAYYHIKALDPTSHVAIAAVVEPTPLRRQYYDMVIDEYQRLYGEKMPVDVWNIHMFILRENNEWGAGIPVGLEAYADMGMLYDVPDHGDISILKGLIREFRRWMTDRGYQDTPLIITEYGLLLAQDYDAGNGRTYDYAFISRFMQRTFDFFRTERDTATGYPADDYRLVQRWCWYSLADTVYPTGNLFDPQTGQMTPIGAAWAEYVREK